MLDQGIKDPSDLCFIDLTGVALLIGPHAVR